MNSPQTVFRHSDIGPVPRDWQDVLFADIFEEYDERVSDTEQYPLYSLTIEEGVVPKTSRYERSFLIKKEEENYRIVHPNDFVYNPMNLRFGALARYKGEKPVCVSAYYDVFRAKKGFNSIYFEAFLTSYPMICYYNRMATGSLIEKQRVHFSQFCQFQLPVPSLPEQQKIAEILSACERVLTLKKELKAQKIKQKKWLMQKLLNPVSGVRLPGFNRKWQKFFLRDIVLAKGQYGINAPACPYDPSLPKYLRITDINEDGKYIKTEPVSVKCQDFDKYLLKNRDIVFARTGASTGKTYLYSQGDGDLVFAGFLIRFTINERFEPRFIFQCTQTNYYKNWVQMMSSRSGQPGINAEEFGSLLLFLPPLAEQSAIAEVLSAADRELDLLEEEIQAWERKKKALSQLLLRGIVRV